MPPHIGILIARGPGLCEDVFIRVYCGCTFLLTPPTLLFLPLPSCQCLQAVLLPRLCHMYIHDFVCLFKFQDLQIKVKYIYLSKMDWTQSCPVVCFPMDSILLFSLSLKKDALCMSLALHPFLCWWTPRLIL